MIPYSTMDMTEPSVTFWGAAQSVTGSMHLVEIGSPAPAARLRPGARPPRRGPPAQHLLPVRSGHARRRYPQPRPYRSLRQSAQFDAQGFRGPIYCTPATRELAAIMLADSGRIHEEDAAVAGVIGRAFDASGASPTRARRRPDHRSMHSHSLRTRIRLQRATCSCVSWTPATFSVRPSRC